MLPHKLPRFSPFHATVTYQVREGEFATFTGSFQAVSAAEASARAERFVLASFRPQKIVSVGVLPA